MFGVFMKKPTLLISNDHQDKTGGGTYGNSE